MSIRSNGFPVTSADEPGIPAPIDQSASASLQASISVEHVLVICSDCKASLRVRQAYIGNRVRCKKCSLIFTVPAAADTEPKPVHDGASGDPPSQSPHADLEPGSHRFGIGNKALLDQLAQFIACHNDLRVAHDQLQSKHNDLRADRKKVRARLKSVTGELDAIRADLGTIAAAGVRSLASEREDLRAEVQRLGGENRNLHTKQSISEDLIKQLENRVLELIRFREGHDTLAETVKLQEGELRAVRAARDALAENLSEKNDEVVAARSERVQLTQQIEQSDTDLQAACQAREQLIEQLELCKDDLSLGRADRRRLSSERQSALDQVEQLKKTLAERDHTIRGQRGQFDVELESNRQVFCLAERNYHDERETLAAVRARNDRLQEQQQSREVLCEQLRDSNQQLVKAQNRVESEYKALLNAERIERQQCAEELLEQRANDEETARVAEQLISTKLNPPEVPFASVYELEAARVEAEQLKHGLVAAECLNRAMAETLQSVGVHVDLPIRSRDSVETEY